jgi:hypothetical protein
MLYLKLTNGQPEKYSIGQLRRDNPNTSFPKNPTESRLAEWSVYPYTQPAQPEIDPLTATVVEGSFEQDAGGNWILPWVVQQLSVEDAGNNVRARRDRFLKDSDWVVIKNTEKGTNIPLEWELYRQTLRDIPQQEGFPYSVTWPTEPGVPAI